jgi:6-phosphogluconolactonase
MTHYIYFGTYTQTSKDAHRKQGIYIYQAPSDPRQPLTFVSAVEDVLNPSFLALHPGKRFLYAVNELWEGQASAFAVNPDTGALSFLNMQPTGGAHPCYLSFDPSGAWLLVSNYSSGSLSVFPIQPDGRLGPRSDLVEHQGKGPNSKRQERTHAHSIRFDPSGQFALAADLGIDHVLVYRLDLQRGKLVPNDPPAAHMTPGAGPRHLAFHPSGQVLYVANELNSTVTACTWDAEKGSIQPFQALSTLPADFQGENIVADIHLAPSGRFLYVSNRGHQSLAAYHVAADGRLTAAGHVSTGGEWPRNFAILPAAAPGEQDQLLVANQYTNNVVAFHISENGLPVPTGQVYEVPLPVCVHVAE